MQGGRGKLARQMKAYTRREHDRLNAVKWSKEAKGEKEVAETSRRLALVTKEVETLAARLKAAGVDLELLQPKKM